MQQALAYAETLDVPFVFSTNGDGFLFHDRLATSGAVEHELQLNQFPSPTELWQRYCQAKGITQATLPVITQSYFSDGGGRTPRYFQEIAINRTIEAIANGQKRVLLVMATGTGKTFTAFQIIWRLWKSGAATRRERADNVKKRNYFAKYVDKARLVLEALLEKYADEGIATIETLNARRIRDAIACSRLSPEGIARNRSRISQTLWPFSVDSRTVWSIAS